MITQNEHMKRINVIYSFQQTKSTVHHTLEMSQLRNSYLFFYNLLQAGGWYHFLSPVSLSFHTYHAHPSVSTYRTVSLFRILSSFISSKSTNGAYSSAGELICECPEPIIMDVCIFFPIIYVLELWCEGLLQSLAFLEVIHGAVGEFQIDDLGVF